MKKMTIITVVLVVALSVFIFGFDKNDKNEPYVLYQVYLEGELIGTIDSKSKLEKYIDDKQDYIKKQYDVDKVYAPNNLEIKKIFTYADNVDKIEDIYEKIASAKSFTIRGYKITMKNTDTETNYYVLDPAVFEEAALQVVTAYIDEEDYQKFASDTQEEIKDFGEIVEDVYIQNDRVIQEYNIPINEKIYTDSDELTKFLLFGDETEQKTYTVKAGDTVADIAFNNEIGITELLISNPEFTSENSLLYAGQKVAIIPTNPQINVVVREHIEELQEINYKTEVRYDNNRLVGDDEVIQKGEKGSAKVIQDIVKVNGIIVDTETLSKEELTPAINEIIIKGGKIIPNVGDLKIWAWPTNSGYIITSNYEYRIHPVTKVRELHDALDIAGTGFRSPIYSANNGTVTAARKNHATLGNYIIINHNNGYQTVYAHLEKMLVEQGQVVSRGQKIGEMGKTGRVTGVHLHFELWKGTPWGGGKNINPWTVYKK